MSRGPAGRALARPASNEPFEAVTVGCPAAGHGESTLDLSRDVRAMIPKLRE